MKQGDLKAFVEALNGISDYYRRDKPTGFTIKLWWESLKEFELEAVQRAFVAHINRADKDGQFMPTVSSLRQLMQGTNTDRASLAWSKVLAAVKGVGVGESVVFDDPIVHRVTADMGGWIQFGKLTEDEAPFKARDFEGRYRGYVQRGDLPQFPGVLIGHYEAHNASRGQPIAPPVLVGNPEKCKRVMQGGTDMPTLKFTVERALPQRK